MKLHKLNPENKVINELKSKTIDKDKLIINKELL